MFPSKKHLFFDLDHTLWDFERCSSETLTELYHDFALSHLGVEDLAAFLRIFMEVNYYLWELHDRGEVDKAAIRKERFGIMFERMGLAPDTVPPGIAEAYLMRCPQKPYVIPYSKEVLDYLAPNYTLHILTNGFQDVQSIKLQSAGLSDYFTCLITSECTGHKKPSQAIFHYAMEQAGAEVHNSLMIGDNLKTDVEGAVAVGMDCVFYNPKNLPHTHQKVKDIHSLQQITELL